MHFASATRLVAMQGVILFAATALHGPLGAIHLPIPTQPTRWPLRCTQIACTADPLAIADPALDGVPNQVEVSPLAGAATDPAIVAEPDPVEPPFEEPGPVEDALAGLTVAFAVLSKAIACSAIVGVEPLVGVWSSVAVGAAAPAFGMRPGVMAGAAAVCAVPLGVFVSANGPELLPFVVLLAAAIEGVVGALRLTRYIDLVSPSVLAGFLNALGVLLFTSQLKVFAAAPDEYAAIGVAATSALIAQLLPRVTSVAVPAGLVGLTVASAAGPLLGLPLVSLASTTADAQAFAGGLASLPRPVDLPALASLVGGSADAFLLALPTAASAMLSGGSRYESSDESERTVQPDSTVGSPGGGKRDPRSASQRRLEPRRGGDRKLPSCGGGALGIGRSGLGPGRPLAGACARVPQPGGTALSFHRLAPPSVVRAS